MSVGSLAKTNTEYWQWVRVEYQKIHPGPFAMVHFLDWALKKGLVDMPKIDPLKQLKRDAQIAMRQARVQDPQNRTVRTIIPAKVAKEVDENGNTLLFEIQYDHIHSMSLTHALNAFDQTEERIHKQKVAAIRNVESFLDNNPNGKGQRSLFEDLDFMHEDDFGKSRVDTFGDADSTPNTPK